MVVNINFRVFSIDFQEVGLGHAFEEETHNSVAELRIDANLELALNLVDYVQF